MITPKNRWQILYGYQIELEDWVEQASLERVKEYLTTSHGLVYPDDWQSFLDAHLNNNEARNKSIQVCEHCQEILPAILTISETSRPEFKTIFNLGK